MVDAKGHSTLPGAEVRLYRAGTREVLGGRLVDTGSAYNSQMIIPLHFGLGKWEGTDRRRGHVHVELGAQDHPRSRRSAQRSPR